jgi:hypothetical protein
VDGAKQRMHAIGTGSAAINAYCERAGNYFQEARSGVVHIELPP